jgi:diguanylate cyclase (GGDEF)-like protein
VDTAKIASIVLNELGVAVMRRTAPGEYVLATPAPGFYLSAFPLETDGSPCQAPWEHSAMLDFFLHDAEAFFETRKEGLISSGVWQEEALGDPDQTLLAHALCSGGEALLLIRLLQDEFAEKVAILRKAREELLEQRSLRCSLQFYKEKSSHDFMTKLYNKETFLNILGNEISNAHGRIADGIPHISLLMIDIDNFKMVNDTYGHLVGDRILTAVGRLLRDSLRWKDVPARYGGEEFIVLLSSTPEQAAKAADKLCRLIARHQEEGLPQVTVSIGCTGYLPEENIESFIRRADQALYDAKHTGKNTYCLR